VRRFFFEHAVSCVLASFTPRSTSRVLKFAVADGTSALINTIGFTTNYAFSMSWVQGRER
jgi:hypothetical protein